MSFSYVRIYGVQEEMRLVGEEPPFRLQRFLAKVTETTVEVRQIGWHKKGFFCFCNGKAWTTSVPRIR